MTFDAIGIAGTGLTVHRKWLDAISDNLANINTAKPTSGTRSRPGTSRPRRARATPACTSPAPRTAAPRAGWCTSRTTPWPTRKATCATPTSTSSSQMGALIMAQRGYQANAAVVDRAKETYQAALEIGRN